MHTKEGDGGSKFELGPRSLRCTGRPNGFNTLCLIEELGLVDETIHVKKTDPAAKNRFIYANGKLNMIPNTLSSALTTRPPFQYPLAYFFLRDLLNKAGDGKDQSIHEFVSKRFHSDFANMAADPMCRGIFAGDCRQLSVYSCFPIIQEFEQLGDGKICRGVIKTMRKPAPKRRDCKLFEKMRNEHWSTFSFKNGLQSLSDTVKDALESKSEVEVHANAECGNILFTDGKAQLTVNGETITADHVVSSIYAKHLASSLSQNQNTLKENLLKIPAVDAVVVVVEFDGHQMPETPGFGHLLPSSEDKSLLGVIYDSCTFPCHDRTDKPSTR